MMHVSSYFVSVRLLSQGANPNYFHPEKNNSTALHIACKSGQAGQGIFDITLTKQTLNFLNEFLFYYYFRLVELLLVYGGDPVAIDKNGRTPSDYAK